MINTIIAFDDNDADLGQYFSESHTDIYNIIALNLNIKNKSINGLDCSADNVNNYLDSLNGQPFIFITLTHGNENEFLTHEVYIGENNAHKFINSFIYSTSCSTGKSIGNILIQKGCFAFIGYESDVNVLPDYEPVFYNCENYGIKSFLNNDETIKESYNKLQDFYTQEIDKLIGGPMEDLIAATTLIGNRASLILIGNELLTRNDFN